jgi:hypothetical protein
MRIAEARCFGDGFQSAGIAAPEKPSSSASGIRNNNGQGASESMLPVPARKADPGDGGPSFSSKARVVSCPPPHAAVEPLRRSTYPEVFGRPAVSRHLVAYLRPFIQAAETCSLDGGDMDEHVLATGVGVINP